MKKSIITLAAVAFLLIFGCQDNPVTGPTGVLNKTGEAATEETINLYYVLEDPAGSSCQLTGEVTYFHQLIDDQSNEAGLYLVSLQLNMKSNLCRLDGPVGTQWSITGQSDYQFYVSEDGIYILNVSYIIEDRMDVILGVQYLVTTEGVGIPNIYLQEID